MDERKSPTVQQMKTATAGERESACTRIATAKQKQ